jgi:hypothetical protein
LLTINGTKRIGQKECDLALNRKRFGFVCSRSATTNQQKNANDKKNQSSRKDPPDPRPVGYQAQERSLRHFNEAR